MMSPFALCLNTKTSVPPAFEGISPLAEVVVPLVTNPPSLISVIDLIPSFPSPPKVFFQIILLQNLII